ncbi:hypothetical protein CWC17_18770 [Pseudoalteromonas sp. S3785]|uniref:hypothetical protein n=1 Tax=Pseudoalteromonas sp. S3785 TaxID=579545 RepID=UPI00110BD77D|nr:hypothetical protein [Pseudoalteromonas sp. S3785]TMO70144.1 hypothetical protein CWC17_18770 [Pseudoalteromonas sp. S3785]
MTDWKKSVSACASTVTIGDISNYINPSAVASSPIDNFYIERNKLLSSISPNYATLNPSIPPLVLVGLISLTENYFREILAGIVKICPKAKQKSATKSLNLATAWIGFGEMEKGAFENTSFSDPKAVKKSLNELIGVNVTNINQIAAPLEEFGKLCELRHAIVHSAGLLAGKNAIKLELPSSRNSLRIKVGYSELQESAEVCSSLVCAVNLELFVNMANKWLNEWPRTPAYRDQNLNILFKKIWGLFYSEFDERNGLISESLTQIKARNLIVKTNAA